MSLDRFAYGIADPQQAKEVGTCCNCSGQIYQDESVIRYEGDLFCDTLCLGEHLLQTADYEEVIA